MGALVNIGLNLIFIPLWGFIAAGYTTLVSYGVYIAMHYSFMRKVQKSEMNGEKVYDLKIILGLCALFAVIAALLVLLYPYFLVRLLLIAVMCAILYWKRDTLSGLWRKVKG